MRKRVLLTFAAFIQAFVLLAQREPSKEILIYFTREVSYEKSFNSDKPTFLVKIKRESLKNELRNLSILESDLKVAAPDFKKQDTVHTLADGKVIRRMDKSKLFVYKLKQNQSQEELIKQLRALPEVLLAQPNGVFTKADAIPNDKYFNNTDDSVNKPNQKPLFDKAGITAAWDIFKGNSNNIIGLIDYGMDETHPDLDGKVVNSDAIGTGAQDHSTKMAGVIAAESNNQIGVAGVDWYARILPKNIDKLGSDGIDQVIRDAVTYSSNVTVLNCSWHQTFDEDLLRSTFAFAYKANVTTVASMGNFSNPFQSIAYPAAFDNIISVGAVNNNDQVESFSGRGSHIDVVAPNRNITTTAFTNFTNPVGWYTTTSETSAAAALVTGIASLLKGYNSSLYNDDIVNLIRLGSDNLDTPGFDTDYGYGRVNAERSMKFLLAPYALEHYTETGPTSDVQSSLTMKFMEAGSLPDGTYSVVRHELTKPVSFPPSCEIIGAWGVGYTSTGWSPANTNFGVGFTEIVPGTLTSTGATLRTYIYDVYSSSNQLLGTYPTNAANVTFGYTILSAIPPIITADTYSYNGSPALTLNPSYNPVDELPAYVTTNFSFAGATSSNAYIKSQDAQNAVTWNTASGPFGLTLNFDFIYPNQWVEFEITASNACGTTIFDVSFFGPSEMGMYMYSPNPASDVLTVEYKYKEDISKEKRVKKEFEVKILNDKGVVVKSEKNLSGTNKLVLNTSKLPNDTYFLYIIEGKREIKHQIIIQH